MKLSATSGSLKGSQVEQRCPDVWTGVARRSTLRYFTGADALTVMTREQESLLDKLLQLAGDSGVVETVIKDLNHDLGRPPTVREVVRAILARQESDLEGALEIR